MLGGIAEKEADMRCPFFEEIMVAYCRAYPVKKMVPSDRLQGNCVCTGHDFESCGLFREIMERVAAADAEPQKERSQEAPPRSDG